MIKFLITALIRHQRHLFVSPVISLLAVSQLIQAEVITLEDKKGNSIIVSPLRKEGDKVIVERMSDGKEFPIDLEILNEQSKKLLIKSSKELAVAYPKLDIDVSIGRRSISRNKYEDLDNITAKITIKNKNFNLPCPPCKGTIVYVGEDLKLKDFYQVLSTQSFNITPTKEGTVWQAEEFINKYYENYWNHEHGYKYQGYLVILTDQKGNIIDTMTTDADIRKALEADVGLPKKFLTYTKDSILNKAMKPTKN